MCVFRRIIPSLKSYRSNVICMHGEGFHAYGTCESLPVNVETARPGARGSAHNQKKWDTGEGDVGKRGHGVGETSTIGGGSDRRAAGDAVVGVRGGHGFNCGADGMMPRPRRSRASTNQAFPLPIRSKT